MAARRKLVAALERDLKDNPNVPGEAISVRAPGLDVTAAVGHADVDAGKPLSATTPFRIASVTKTFVAVAVLRLVEEQKVELDAPVADDISPESAAILTSGGYAPDDITVRELLNHTSGLFDYAVSEEYDQINTDDPGRHWTRAEQLQFAVDHGTPVGAPGEKYRYSDTGYVLLGEILERSTGQSLPTAVRSLIDFTKLGLDHTYWEDLEPTPAGTKARAHQYYDDAYDNIDLDASADLYGGGGLVSTVGDLTRFYRALFHGGIFHDDATLRTMTEVSKPGKDHGAAMGVFAVDVDGEQCFSHPGYWGTETTYCPSLDLTFARTTNQADDTDFDSGPVEHVVADLAR